MYPNNTFFDADRYFNDLSLRIEKRPCLVDELANSGLDLLSGIIGNLSREQDWGDFVKGWLRGLIMKTITFRPWIYEIDQYQTWDHRTVEELVPEEWEFFSSEILSSSDRDSLRPHIAENLRVHKLIEEEPLEPWQRPYMRQVQIYRQRAWGLFDDERLYANATSSFPTLEHLDSLETMDREGDPELQTRSS
jgi:hypothetical protein